MSSAKERFFQSLVNYDQVEVTGHDAVQKFQNAVEELGKLIGAWLEGRIQLSVSDARTLCDQENVLTKSYTLRFKDKHVSFVPLHVRAIGSAGVIGVKGLRYDAQLTLSSNGEWWVTTKKFGEHDGVRQLLDEEGFFALLEDAR
ncbi:hypothetical protein ACKI2N_015570 [Cupriavidus sp. 30B13]|uniref:hypothetical protein n=1 Tax=Cupriavidus sp. 30B13 TaxID=3384241 RepID=UPI003B912643